MDSVRIRKADLSNEKDLAAVQRIYAESQASLWTNSADLAIRSLLSRFTRPAVSVLLWMTFAFVLCRYVAKISVASSILAATTLTGFGIASLYALFYWMSRSGFSHLVKEVTTEQDLSPKLATSVYNKPHSKTVLFVAESFAAGDNNSKGSRDKRSDDVIVGCAGIHIGAEANTFMHRENNDKKVDISLLKEDGTEGRLTRVGVLPGHMGHGIGKMLVQRCIDYARASDLARLLLVTSSAQFTAIHMYKRFGFKLLQTRGIFPALGFCSLVMAMDLNEHTT
eukprot:TRINITY_DN7673_c0_g1_i1.p1 TRINITY_DN7673_c0_g1~~TRINITY_DN7673_c0_g1_i1.p1  ORF type:complete len:281 (-),score=32.88 TRINITY_DN7673_c0_g1_i1:94-936(-)